MALEVLVKDGVHAGLQLAVMHKLVVLVQHGNHFDHMHRQLREDLIIVVLANGKVYVIAADHVAEVEQDLLCEFPLLLVGVLLALFVLQAVPQLQ